MSPSEQSPIQAAGVVLLRQDAGVEEFVVVHRPGRQDWSLPKGKIEPGEHMVVAAARECDEESGYTPLLQAPLTMQSYLVDGRPKVVHYWRARVREEVGFAPDDEVDEVMWLPVSAARKSLTYPSEAQLVKEAASLPDTVPLVLLRHTQALKRSQFDGSVDAERPLSGKGRSQSKVLIPLLDAFGVTRVHSSPSRRCHDTVKRFARHVDAEIVPEPALAEEGHAKDPEAAAARVAELALLAEPLVLCSHRPVFPTILGVTASVLGVDPGDDRWRQVVEAKLPPGGFIVVHRAFGDDGEAHVAGVELHTPAATVAG